MKTAYELTKPEKVEFLKRIQAKEINPKEFTEPPVFSTKTGDTFLALLQERKNVIPITPEAMRDAEGVNEAINGR
jgi:fibrillarin-like rRNA methylase